MNEKKITKISTKITRLVALSIAFVAFVASAGGSVLLGSKMMRTKKEYLRLATYTIVQETAMMSAENTTMETVTMMLADFKTDNETDVTIFDYDTRAFSTLEGATGTRMDNAIWRALQSGQPYFSKKANVNGIKYYAYYSPVMKDGECVGAIFAGQPASTVDNGILIAMANTLMIGVFSGLIFVTIALKISRRMGLRLSRLRRASVCLKYRRRRHGPEV